MADPVTNPAPTDAEIAAMIAGLQTELKAGRYEKPAQILSVMLESAIKPEDLKKLIDAANGRAQVPLLGEVPLDDKTKVEQINKSLKEINPNTPDLSLDTINKLAKIADLPPEEFMNTLKASMPDIGMQKFNEMALALRAAPATPESTTQSVFDAATTLASKNQPPAPPKSESADLENMTFMSFLKNPKAAMASMQEGLGTLMNGLGEFVDMLKGSGEGFMVSIGQFLEGLIGSGKQMLAGLTGGKNTEAADTPAPETTKIEEPALDTEALAFQAPTSDNLSLTAAQGIAAADIRAEGGDYSVPGARPPESVRRQLGGSTLEETSGSPYNPAYNPANMA